VIIRNAPKFLDVFDTDSCCSPETLKPGLDQHGNRIFLTDKRMGRKALVVICEWCGHLWFTDGGSFWDLNVNWVPDGAPIPDGWIISTRSEVPRFDEGLLPCK